MTFAANGIKCIGNVEVIANSTGQAGDITVDGAMVAAGPLGVQLTGTQPAKNVDPGANNVVVAPLVCKAQGVFAIGGGTITYLDGANISAQSIIALSQEVVITFARPMASANYSVTWGVEDDSVNTPIPQINGTKTSTGFRFNLWKSTDGSLIDLSVGSSRKVSFHVFGRQ